MTKRNIASVVACIALLLFSSGQSASADQATKSVKPSLPESVAFEIDEAATKFNKAVGDGLGQRLEELKATLKDAAARVRAALERAQGEQSDAGNQSYEMAVSSELLRVQTSLQAIVGEQAAVMDAQRDLAHRLEGVRASLTKDEATYAREIKERQTEVARLSGQLEALAEKHRDAIENKVPLSVQDDLQVRALTDRLRLAEQGARLTERAAQEASARVAKLREFDVRLWFAGGEFKLLFQRAGGQVGLLGRLADMRRKGIEVSSVIGTVNKVTQQMAAVDAVLEDTSTTLDELLDAPLMADTTEVIPAPQPRRSGLEVLADFVQRRQAAKAGGQ